MERTLGRGINFGGALDGERGSAGVALGERHLDTLRETGFTTVRLPVRWSAHLAPDPPYTIDRAFLERVDGLVSAGLRRGLQVVLTVHHFAAICADPDRHAVRLLAIWSQLAERYAGTDRRLHFELLNEPSGAMTDRHWNRLLADALAVVRAVDPERPVIAGPVRWNIVDALPGLELPADEHLTATVHYYSPFRFTHQGAGWLEGADAWRGTAWGSQAELDRVSADLERAASWAAERGRPLFLGEFGTHDVAQMDDRARWTAHVRREAERLGMSWSYWDFATDFGAFDLTRDAWRPSLADALLGTG
jgi:endoglucanase